MYGSFIMINLDSRLRGWETPGHYQTQQWITKQRNMRGGDYTRNIDYAFSAYELQLRTDTSDDECRGEKHNTEMKCQHLKQD